MYWQNPLKVDGLNKIMGHIYGYEDYKLYKSNQ